jgi:hypothetical protein
MQRAAPFVRMLLGRLFPRVIRHLEAKLCKYGGRRAACRQYCRLNWVSQAMISHGVCTFCITFAAARERPCHPRGPGGLHCGLQLCQAVHLRASWGTHGQACYHSRCVGSADSVGMCAANVPWYHGQCLLARQGWGQSGLFLPAVMHVLGNA